MSRVDTRALQSGMVRMRFRLHPDQYDNVRAALDVARAQTGTEFDHVALDAICTAFLTTHAGSPPNGAPRPLRRSNDRDH